MNINRLSFDAHDILDVMMGCAESVGRVPELVASVGIWFAKRFCELSAEDRLDVLCFVRPWLRKAGFDICDSELGEPVGCEHCLNPNINGACKEMPVEDDRAKVSISIYRHPGQGIAYSELRTRVNLSDQYAYGFDMPINYCPICGRYLGVNHGKKVEEK